MRFEKCTFYEFLDFSEAIFKQTLHIVHCRILNGIYLMDTIVEGRCSFRCSRIRGGKKFWLNWRGLKTGRGLHLIGMSAYAPLDLYQALIGGDLHLSGLHVLAKGRPADQVWANKELKPIERHHVATELVGKAINLEGARIQGYFNGGAFAAAKDATDGTANIYVSVKYMKVLGTLDLQASIGGDVRIGDATIDAGINRKALNMASSKVDGSILIRGRTRITGSIDLRAQIGGQIAIQSTTVNAGTQERAVTLADATVGGSVFVVEGTSIDGPVDLRARIDGQVAFSNAMINAAIGSTAVNMDAATVGGSVFFKDGTHVTGSIDLRARIGGQIEFNDATVNNGVNHNAIVAQGSTIGNAFILTNGTVVGGHVVLFQAKLGGGITTTFRVDRKTFDRPGVPAFDNRVHRHCLIVGDLVLDHAVSAQSAWLHGLSVLGKVHARHLRVAGDMHVCGGVAGKMDATGHTKASAWILLSSRATHLYRLGAIWNAERFDKYSGFVAPLFLLNAKSLQVLASRVARGNELLWHSWELEGKLRDPESVAIDLELADIQGHLWIRGQHVLGTVHAELARVKGDVSFDHSLIEGDLVLRDAKVDAKFFAEPTTMGEPAPLVRGKIDASSGVFETVVICLGDANKQNEGLAKWYLFDSATVGSLFLFGHLATEGRKLFSVHRLRFQDLRFERLTGGNFKWWSKRDELRAALAFDLACVGITAIVLGCWPSGYGWVFAGIITYLMIAGCIVRGGILARRKSPSRPLLDILGRSRFSHAFYIDAEHWARAGGDDLRADEIFLERRRRELRERRPGVDASGKLAEVGEKPEFHWFTRWWRWGVLDFMFGYGVRPARAIHLFALLWLINWAVFLHPTAVSGTTSARQAEARTHSTFPAPSEWDAQGAFFMAMRLQIPFVDLFIDAEWKPADRAMFARGIEGRGIALTYENWAAVMRILNLILVPIIIAGATGYLKPREAQYTGS